MLRVGYPATWPLSCCAISLRESNSSLCPTILFKTSNRRLDSESLSHAGHARLAAVARCASDPVADDRHGVDSRCGGPRVTILQCPRRRTASPPPSGPSALFFPC